MNEKNRKNKEIGKRLRDLRDNVAHLSRSQLAEKFSEMGYIEGDGFSIENIKKDEYGNNNISREHAKVYAEFYGVSVDYILLKTDDKNATNNFRPVKEESFIVSSDIKIIELFESLGRKVAFSFIRFYSSNESKRTHSETQLTTIKNLDGFSFSDCKCYYKNDNESYEIVILKVIIYDDIDEDLDVKIEMPFYEASLFFMDIKDLICGQINNLSNWKYNREYIEAQKSIFEEESFTIKNGLVNVASQNRLEYALNQMNMEDGEGSVCLLTKEEKARLKEQIK